MKVAIITDTHWSCRKSSKLFQDYFELFYKNVFFPTLEQYGIKTVIHMGDAFDSRKSIDFSGLEWTRRVVLNPLSKYDVHLITGNHDIYYKNTNLINSPNLLLNDYSNIKIYSSTSEIKIDNLNILLIPWINSENEDFSFNMIKKSKSPIAMGHLEFKGFKVNKNLIMEDHGLDSDKFSHFVKVFSGHYHTRSNNGKIYYLGNPYEMFTNDSNDPRGFTIFDTETLEHFHIDNPYKLFYNVYYENTPFQTFDSRNLTNKIVKVIVKKKDDQKQFDKFLDKIYTSNPYEIKIVENFQISQSEEFEAFESEDTLSILDRYIEESEIDMDKSIIQKLIRELYEEACEVV